MACQPASLPATAPAPQPAGTFALWLQFPGMPNLRQLLRTCYLCQQCAGSAHHITCHSVSIWARDWICVRIVCQRITVPLTHHICICISSCVHECKAFLCVVCTVPMCIRSDVANVVCTACVHTSSDVCVYVCVCVSICVCWASLACIWSSIEEAFQQGQWQPACQTAQMLVL